MGIVCLRKLSLTAFRSFVDTATISLPKSGLVLIRGKNLDKPGVSSGTGKTSLLLGLSHAFGYCPFPATELQSWLTDQSMEVSVEFEDGTSQYELARGSKTTFKVDGKAVKGAAAIQSAIEKATGVGSELLAALTYRPQRERGLFVSKTDGEKKEFLATLLRLDELERAIEESKDKIDSLAGMVSIRELASSTTAKTLETARAVKFPVKQPVDQFSVSEKAAAQEIELVKQQVTDARNRLTDWQNEKTGQLQQISLEARKVSCPEPQLPVLEIDGSKVKELEEMLGQINERISSRTAKNTAQKREWEDEARRLEKQMWSIEALRKTLKDLDAQRDTLENEIASLNKNTCPTCGQEWIENQNLIERKVNAYDEAFKKVQEIEAELERLPALKARLDTVRINVAEEDPTLAKLVEVREDMRAQLHEEQINITRQRGSYNAQVEAAKAEAFKQYTALTSQFSQAKEAVAAKYDPLIAATNTAIQLAQNALNDATRRYTEAHTNFVNAEKFNAWAEEEIKRLEGEISKANAAHEDSLASLQAAKDSLAAEQDLQALCKGFLGAIFDEVLAEIADETNKMLAPVPNVSHVTLRFTSEVTTGKGTVKRSIVPILSVGGHEHPLRSALSGGMQSAVELAVDLAVRRVISRRTGSNPGWLLLDEAMDGLGVAEKEAMMNILRNEARDTLIMVVDHSSEIKEGFDRVIDVVSSGGRSRIRGEEEPLSFDEIMGPIVRAVNGQDFFNHVELSVKV